MNVWLYSVNGQVSLVCGYMCDEELVRCLRGRRIFWKEYFCRVGYGKNFNIDRKCNRINCIRNMFHNN